MKFFLVSFLAFFAFESQAQIGIGTSTPDASAKVEISSTSKGFLLPRVALTGKTDVSTIASPATALVVYNTATAGSSPNNVTPGFYYYSGSEWVRFVIPTDNVSNISGTVAIANGGTGSTTKNFVDLSTDQTVAGIKSFGAISATTLNGLIIKTGGGSISSNIAIGNSNTFNGNLTGTSNFIYGANAGMVNTSGSNNIAMGGNGLRYNTTGSNNIALGSTAMQGNTTGNNNVAIGSSALSANATGSNLTAIGNGASIADGKTNSTAIGNGANVTTDNTIQLGNGSVTTVNTSGNIVTSGNVSAATFNGVTLKMGGGSISSNIAIGNSNTLNGNSTGTSNFIYGANAAMANTSGSNNIAMGGEGLRYNTTGSDNIALGNTAMQSNTTGNYNVAIGRAALTGNQTGSNLTAIGNGASITDGKTNSTAIGNGANVTTDNTIQLGNGSVTNVKTSGTLTAGTVTYPNTHNATAGQVLTTNSSGVASWANNSGITGNGTENYLPKYGSGGTSITNSLVYDNGTSVGINTNNPSASYKLEVNGKANFTNDIVVNGIKIGKGIDPGYGLLTTSFGFNALSSFVSGAYGSTAFGNQALEKNTSGAYNNALGILALQNITTGSANTGIGSCAGTEMTTGSSNVIIGHEAGRYLNTDGNTIIGYRAGQTCCGTNSTNQSNTYIGYLAGNGVTGSYNTILGASGNGTFSNNIILADGAGNIRYRWNGTTNDFNSGSVNAGSFNITSDFRLKTNISSLSKALNTIMQLNPVHYYKKNNLDSTNYTMEENGFIAQELRKIMPYIVKESTDKNKLLSVDYTSIIPILTKGIQEQQAMIEAQQKQIEKQQNQIDAQKKQLNEIVEIVKKMRQ